MRPVKVYVNSVADSQWIPIDYTGIAFAIGFAVIPSYGATATFSVQHCLDEADPTRRTPVSLSRTGTTVTVTDYGLSGLGHSMSTGDNVIIKGNGNQLDTPIAVVGSSQGDIGADVTVTGYNTYTYQSVNAGPTADSGNAVANHLKVFNHAVVVGATARTDGNYAFPIRYMRLKVTAFSGSNAFVEMAVLQGRSA